MYRNDASVIPSLCIVASITVRLREFGEAAGTTPGVRARRPCRRGGRESRRALPPACINATSGPTLEISRQVPESSVPQAHSRASLAASDPSALEKRTALGRIRVMAHRRCAIRPAAPTAAIRVGSRRDDGHCRASKSSVYSRQSATGFAATETKFDSSTRVTASVPLGTVRTVQAIVVYAIVALLRRQIAAAFVEVVPQRFDTIPRNSTGTPSSPAPDCRRNCRDFVFAAEERRYVRRNDAGPRQRGQRNEFRPRVFDEARVYTIVSRRWPGTPTFSVGRGS